MQIKSRIFGEIEIDDEKIITIPNGIMGFEQYQKYAIAFDSENESKNGIMWLQSLEEENLAFPVMDPTIIKEDYNLVPKSYLDAASIIYKEDQETFQGGSGPVVIPLVLMNKILKEKKHKRILLLATGSLHSPLMVNLKKSIPSITHAVSIEVIT